MRVGIAGASGFIGGALAAKLERDRDGFDVVRIGRAEWTDDSLPARICDGCDALVMAAGMSRSEDPAALYRTNIDLARTLVRALDAAAWKGRLIFLSTTHEAKDTPYHASKRDSRALFDAWAAASGGVHIGALLPNTFGPGGKIFYNSAVSTFAWQVAHGKEPTIHQDSEMQLCFIDRTVDFLTGLLTVEPPPENPSVLASEFSVGVAETVTRLKRLRSGDAPQDAYDRALARTLAFYCDGGGALPSR